MRRCSARPTPKSFGAPERPGPSFPIILNFHPVCLLVTREGGRVGTVVVALVFRCLDPSLGGTDVVVQKIFGRLRTFGSDRARDRPRVEPRSGSVSKPGVAKLPWDLGARNRPFNPNGVASSRASDGTALGYDGRSIVGIPPAARCGGVVWSLHRAWPRCDASRGNAPAAARFAPGAAGHPTTGWLVRASPDLREPLCIGISFLPE